MAKVKVTRVVEASTTAPGRQLMAIRQERGIRPSRVAKETGMSCQRINDIERMDRGLTITTVQAYCQAIGARLCIVYDTEE